MNIPQRDRRDVLAEVNQVLEHEGLPLWTSLRRIGKHRQGENEILGVDHVIRDLKEYYVIIVFRIKRPDGSLGLYGVRTSRRQGVCAITLINDQVLFVQQHRLTLGKWTIELPRGWVDTTALNSPTDAMRALLVREVGDAYIDSIVPFAPVEIGDVWEDTGTRMNSTRILFARGASNIPLPKRVGDVIPRLYTFDQIHQMEDDGAIRDQATLAALRRAERHISKTRSV